MWKRTWVRSAKVGLEASQLSRRNKNFFDASGIYLNTSKRRASTNVIIFLKKDNVCHKSNTWGKPCKEVHVFTTERQYPCVLPTFNIIKEHFCQRHEMRNGNDSYREIKWKWKLLDLAFGHPWRPLSPGQCPFDTHCQHPISVYTHVTFIHVSHLPNKKGGF